MIFNLSYPAGRSVNDSIAPEDASVSYTRFDKIVHMVGIAGRGSYLVKVDIKSAFRLLPRRLQPYVHI